MNGVAKPQCGAPYRNYGGVFRYCTAEAGHKGQHWTFVNGVFVAGWTDDESHAPPPVIEASDEIVAWLRHVARSADRVDRDAAKVLLEAVCPRTAQAKT